MPGASRDAARRAIVEVLAADAACEPSAFDDDDITVVEWRDLPGRRRFDLPTRPFQIVTMGHGLVVSCHRDWLDWSRERAESLDRSQFLAPANLSAIVTLLEPAGHALVGPHTCYGCSADTRRAASTPSGVTLGIFEGAGIEALRHRNAFPNALASRPNPTRPDVLAVTATASGTVVACAGASADSDDLWQVGVDVLAPWRGRGIGRAVVGRLAQAILHAGKVPYYSHNVSNIPSAALATGLGFWPAWVQWYAQEQR